MWRLGTGCPTGRGGGPSLPCNLTQTCWPTGRRTARRRRGDGATTARRRRDDGATTARRPSAPRENGRDSAVGHALLPQRPRAECAKENRECESARAESDGSDSAFRCFFCVAPRSRRARATVSAHAARTRDVCTRFTTRPRAQRDLALCNERANTRRTRLLASRSHTISPTHTHDRGTWRARIPARYALAFFLLDVRRTLPAGQVLATRDAVRIVRPAVAVEDSFCVAGVLVAAAARVPHGRGMRGRHDVTVCSISYRINNCPKAMSAHRDTGTHAHTSPPGRSYIRTT